MLKAEKVIYKMLDLVTDRANFKNKTIKAITLVRSIILKHYPELSYVGFESSYYTTGYDTYSKRINIYENDLLDDEWFSREVHEPLIFIGKPKIPRHLFVLFTIFHEYGHAHGYQFNIKNHGTLLGKNTEETECNITKAIKKITHMKREFENITITDGIAYRLLKPEVYADNFAYRCLDLLKLEQSKIKNYLEAK